VEAGVGVIDPPATVVRFRTTESVDPASATTTTPRSRR
jgi:hypothetical protein